MPRKAEKPVHSDRTRAKPARKQPARSTKTSKKSAKTQGRNVLVMSGRLDEFALTEQGKALAQAGISEEAWLSQSRSAPMAEEREVNAAGKPFRGTRGSFVKGDPRINRSKPGPGRPPNRWKRLMQRIANKPHVLRRLRTMLQDGEYGDFLDAFKFVVEQGYGKAGQSVDLNAKVSLAALVAQANRPEED